MDNSEDLRILEAIIFASSEPILESVLKEKIVNKENLRELLEELKNFYINRGVVLKKTGDTWSFKTAPDLSDKLTIFKKQKRKLSRAALETLAIIAYHQPVTRAEIEVIRGVQMGRGSIDYLMQIGWIKPKGRRNTPGRPTTWGTTSTFLEHFERNPTQYGYLVKHIEDYIEKYIDPKIKTENVIITNGKGIALNEYYANQEAIRTIYSLYSLSKTLGRQSNNQEYPQVR